MFWRTNNRWLKRHIYFHRVSSLPSYHNLLVDKPVSGVSLLLWTFVGEDMSNMSLHCGLSGISTGLTEISFCGNRSGELTRLFRQELGIWHKITYYWILLMYFFICCCKFDYIWARQFKLQQENVEPIVFCFPRCAKVQIFLHFSQVPRNSQSMKVVAFTVAFL